jgi:hypothetical protein
LGVVWPPLLGNVIFFFLVWAFGGGSATPKANDFLFFYYFFIIFFKVCALGVAGQPPKAIGDFGQLVWSHPHANGGGPATQ